MKKSKNPSNWQKVKNKINKKKYATPDGWDSRDTVAEQLKCDPSKVSKILSFGIESGDILCRQFYVWDDIRGTAIIKTFYKENIKESECGQEDLKFLHNIRTAKIKDNFSDSFNGPVKRVFSRHRKIEGTLYQDKSVTWDNGKISFPSESSWRKRDIYIIP
jgi:hypothetical protein